MERLFFGPKEDYRLMNKILKQFAQCTTREVLEILDEVFSLRMIFDKKIQKYKRWFVVSYCGQMHSGGQGFLPDNEEPVEVEYLAQPLITFYENEDYFEQGGCPCCHLLIVCTHKYAKCPYCFSNVGCT